MYDSNLATWFFTFIATDFCYYWFHRMAHEVNIMWAGHVIHHSSEYYNLSTALRHSVFQELCSWIFYMPMAFMIPPPMFAFHKQLNLFTQFWIHTETIPRLGWLEYIINTPSAHRVHHGRNPYCIDKNYAGALIIWDRMFGTYQDELVYPQVVDSKDKEEKVAYGITHPINTFNPLVIQTHHLRHVLTTAFSVKGIANKFKAVFFGPGWHEGTARLGDPEEIPKIEQSSPPVKYDPIIPFTMNLYCVIQTAATAGIADYVLLRLSSLPGVFLKLAAVWIFFAYYSLGSIMDRKPYFRELELFRLFAGVVLCNYVSSHSDLYQISRFIPWSLNILYLVSILFLIWTYISQKSK
ncbi:hypothetical protein HK103_002938 [Boothiomyces macroporosus]|uniref:Fatty acid hydroxylase domain-containing protein n=1 Tax=Boothiomyces macroporosus TaxID=261099 RepID=A0AAD5Y4M1_9FUNG|nr:hypothetical protein HK103_002938 [Boothiomyces macroporosus]